MNTLGDIVRRNARLFPHHVAIVDGDRTITHQALHRRGNALAHGLARRQIEAGDRVAVLARNCAAMLEIYAACELSGRIAVGLNWRLAAPELARIIRDCTPKILFHTAEFAPVVAALTDLCGDAMPPAVCIDGSDGAYERLAATDGSDDWRVDADAIAYLIYTSGTTGLPKGVMLDHRGQLAVAAAMALETRAQLDDRLLVVMPLFHIGARCKALGYHYRGASVTLRPAFDPADVLRALDREPITALHVAPTMLQALLDARDAASATQKGSTLRAIHYAAAPMPVPLLRRGLAAFGPIFTQFYGMTESGPLGTVLQPAQHQPDGRPDESARLASAGQPSAGCAIRVVRANGDDADVGEPGEVLIRAPALMAGYWRNPDATASALQEGWLHSGDIGYLDDEAFLFLIDRKKDMVVTGGENVYPREVEDALLAHPAVAQVAVIGVPDAHWGESVVAVVVRRADAVADADELIAHTRTLIASYKKPRAVHFVDALPLLATGKVDKKVLRSRYSTAATARVSS